MLRLGSPRLGCAARRRYWARWAHRTRSRRARTCFPIRRKGKERSVDHPLVAAYFLRHSVPSALRGTADNDAGATKRLVVLAGGARRRKARALSVQILVLAELAARGAAALGRSSKRSAAAPTRRKRRTKDPRRQTPPAAFVARPAESWRRRRWRGARSPRALAPTCGRPHGRRQPAGGRVRGSWRDDGRRERVAELAPLRGVARATLATRSRTTRGSISAPRTAAAPPRSLRRRRLAAGYRALANVNLLVAPAAATPRRTSGAEPKARVPKSSQRTRCRAPDSPDACRRARRSAGGVPAQVDAGREWVTLAAHIGASPGFGAAAPETRRRFGGARARRVARLPSSSLSRVLHECDSRRAFLQTFRKESSRLAELPRVRRGARAPRRRRRRRRNRRAQLCSHAGRAAGGAATSFVETRSSRLLRRTWGRSRRSPIGRRRRGRVGARRDSEDERKTRFEPSRPETHRAVRRRRRACVELARRAVALDAARARTGRGVAACFSGTACGDERGGGGTHQGTCSPAPSRLSGVPARGVHGQATSARRSARRSPRSPRCRRRQRRASRRRRRHASRGCFATPARRAAAAGAPGAARGGGGHSARRRPRSRGQARAADTLAAVVAVVADDADGGAAALAATAAVRPPRRRGRPRGAALAWPAGRSPPQRGPSPPRPPRDVDEASSPARRAPVAGGGRGAKRRWVLLRRASRLCWRCSTPTPRRGAKSGETSPCAVVAGARVAYAALAAMYERCSETVAAGQAPPSPRSTRRCRAALDPAAAGGRVARVRGESAGQWARRRGLEGFIAREVSRSRPPSWQNHGIDDRRSKRRRPRSRCFVRGRRRRGASRRVQRLRRARRAHATQSEILREVVRGWRGAVNALVGGGDAPLRLEDATSAALFATADEADRDMLALGSRRRPGSGSQRPRASR